MKFIYLSIALSLVSAVTKAQNILISNNAKITFFSSTVIEDIEGKSSTAGSVIDLKTGAILFKVNNTSFQFKKKLMQEHFNENYMESDKYPISEFKGSLKEPIDLSKDGTIKVTVEGILNIHGVKKNYTTPAELTIKQRSLSAKATFKVKIADHGIDIPTIVFKNIAEFIEVSILATYQEKK